MATVDPKLDNYIDRLSEAMSTNVIANAMDQVKEMEVDAQEDNAMETDPPAEDQTTTSTEVPRVDKINAYEFLDAFKRIHPPMTQEGIPEFAKAFKLSEARATELFENSLHYVKDNPITPQAAHAMELDPPTDQHPTIYDKR